MKNPNIPSSLNGVVPDYTAKFLYELIKFIFLRIIRKQIDLKLQKNLIFHSI